MPFSVIFISGAPGTYIQLFSLWNKSKLYSVFTWAVSRCFLPSYHGVAANVTYTHHKSTGIELDKWAFDFQGTWKAKESPSLFMVKARGDNLKN